MKELSYEEYRKRLAEIQKARKIFVETGLTKNITRAFEVYLEIFAKEKMDLFINKITAPNTSPFDECERPLCSECGTELRLSPMPIVVDGHTYPTTWVCENCGMEYYTEKTVEEWYEMLRKDKNEDTREDDKNED